MFVGFVFEKVALCQMNTIQKLYCQVYFEMISKIDEASMLPKDMLERIDELLKRSV